MRQPDASKLQNGNGIYNGHQTSWPRPRKRPNCQIHHIIGDVGKYQIMIFLFKILIGVVSPFNNLGVTFFAPRDFVGYWCADEPVANNLSTILQNATLIQAQNYTHQYSIDTHYASSAMNQLPFDKVVAMPMERRHQVDHMEVLSSFLLGEERSARHSMNLNYDTPKSLRRECNSGSQKANKCKSHKFNTGIWISTIIDEWDLVCDKSWYISLSQSLYMSGFIVAYLVFGQFSDTYGRWRSLLLGALIEIGCGFGCAFSNSITSFLVFRFLLGIGNAGRTTSSYLIMIEWFGPKSRVYISTLGALGWIVGYCAMPWLSLYFLHFRHLQLFACFYEIVFLVWLFTLPESPRWLMTHNRFDKAYEVLLMAAKYNGLIKKESSCEKVKSNSNGAGTKTANGHYNCCDKIMVVGHEDEQQNGCNNNGALQGNLSMCAISPLQDKGLEKLGNVNGAINVDGAQNNYADDDNNCVLEPYTLVEFNQKFQHLVDTFHDKEFTENEDKPSLLDLFRWKNLTRWALILFFIWAMNSFIYYGIVLGVGSFGAKNLFYSFTIAGITEIPSMVLSMIFLDYFPRKRSSFFILTLVGVLCAIQAPLKFYDQGNLQLVTIMLAKIFNSCAFTVVLYQTMEIFPTSIRQTSYSACSLSGRIGSILAPFTNELSNATSELVPPMIYAALSVIGLIVTGSLPETKGADMPDTLLEAEKFESTQRGDRQTRDQLAASRQ